MGIDKSLVAPNFTLDSVPAWRCPVCGKGLLRGDKEDFQVHQTKKSERERKEEEYWEPEWIRGQFIGRLLCDKAACEEAVAVIGTMRVEEHWYDTPDGCESSYKEVLTPTLFQPAVPLFNVHASVPELVRQAFKSCFEVYWLDTAACGNKIRIVAERLLDAQSVPTEQQTKKGKTERLSLHARIERFKVQQPVLSEMLLAVKWLGNHGSHTADELTRDDLIHGFEMLTYVAHHLYDNEPQRLLTLSRAINSAKGPIRIPKPQPPRTAADNTAARPTGNCEVV